MANPFPSLSSCSPALSGGNFLIEERGFLSKAPLPAVGAVSLSQRPENSIPGNSREASCISFGWISFPSTFCFLKGNICFQALPDQHGLPEIRVTNWHTGNKLGSLNAISSLSWDETQPGLSTWAGHTLLNVLLKMLKTFALVPCQGWFTLCPPSSVPVRVPKALLLNHSLFSPPDQQ